MRSRNARARSAEQAQNDIGDIHLITRDNQFDRNLLRPRRLVRTALRQTSRWLDQMVPDHDRADERDGILFSVSWFHACSRSWDHIAVGVGGCDLCALPAAT